MAEKQFAPTQSPIGQHPPLGLQKLVGYEIDDWKDGFARVRLPLDERHTNRGGFVHGGLFSIILDSAGGLCGCFVADPDRVRRCVTLSLTTDFIAQPRTPVMFATGRLTGGGRTTFFARMHVMDAEDNVCAQGLGTYRYIKGSGDPAGIPRDGAG